MKRPNKAPGEDGAGEGGQWRNWHRPIISTEASADPCASVPSELQFRVVELLTYQEIVSRTLDLMRTHLLEAEALLMLKGSDLTSALRAVREALTLHRELPEEPR